MLKMLREMENEETGRTRKRKQKNIRAGEKTLFAVKGEEGGGTIQVKHFY